MRESYVAKITESEIKQEKRLHEYYKRHSVWDVGYAVLPNQIGFCETLSDGACNCSGDLKSVASIKSLKYFNTSRQWNSLMI